MFKNYFFLFFKIFVLYSVSHSVLAWNSEPEIPPLDPNIYTAADPNKVGGHSVRYGFSNKESTSVPLGPVRQGEALRLRILLPPGAGSVTISTESGQWQGVLGPNGTWLEDTFVVVGEFDYDARFCSSKGDGNSCNGTPGTFIHPNQLGGTGGGLSRTIYENPARVQTPQYFYFVFYNPPKALSPFFFSSFSISIGIGNKSAYNAWRSNRSWAGGSGDRTGINDTGSTTPPTVDSDSDGIPDAQDPCPTVFGTQCPTNSVQLALQPSTGGRITITANNDVAKTCSASRLEEACSQTYPSGTLISLQAIRNENYSFVNWTGDCQGIQGITANFEIQRNTTCGATFQLDSIGNPTTPTNPSNNLTVNIGVPQNGFVTSSDRQINQCTANLATNCSGTYTNTQTNISFTATQNAGYLFNGWICNNVAINNNPLSLSSLIINLGNVSTINCSVNFIPNSDLPPTGNNDNLQSQLPMNLLKLRVGDSTAELETEAELVFYGNVIRNKEVETLSLETLNALEAGDIVNLSAKITPNPKHEIVDLIAVSSWGDASNPMRKVFEKVEAQDFFGFNQLGWSQWETVSAEKLNGLTAYAKSVEVNDKSYIIDIGHGQLKAPSGLESKGRIVAFYVGYRYLDRLTGQVYLVVNEKPILLKIPDAPVPTLIPILQNICAYTPAEGSCGLVRNCRVEPEELLMIKPNPVGVNEMLCFLYAEQTGSGTLYITNTQGVETAYSVEVIDPSPETTETPATQ